MYSKYPDMPMELFLNATDPPVLQVSKGANFTLKGIVDVNVVQKNKTLTKAFTLGLVRKIKERFKTVSTVLTDCVC